MFATCSPDPEPDENSGLKGWYTDLSDLGKQSDFDKINTAIRNREVLSSYKYGGETHEYVASRDLFINSDGRYNDSDAYYGRLRFTAPTLINVIRILDEQTLVFYTGWLYEDGAYNAGEALYTFYAGSIFGDMTYYGTPTYYTYAKIDNKLIVSNGDIYTVTSSGLIKDGSSDLWSKYDPKKKNTGKNENTSDKNETNSTTGTINGHAYVDLGLSVKWATCNVGASKPEDYGDYYAWGETTTKSDYSWETYKWCKGTYKTITKYCTDSYYGTVDNRTTLTSLDDVATVKWGSKWRMPTKEEMEELNEDCTWTWTTQSGVNGMKVTGPNGNSIFLPAAGNRYGTDFYYRGSYGLFWSATLDGDDSGDAYALFFEGYGRSNDHWGRLGGFPVRPVTD